MDYVLKNVNYLDVYNKKFIKGNIRIKDGYIYSINEEYSNVLEYDLDGKYVVPSFIDGHIHLESSIISPEDFAKMVSIHGTGTVVADPHEIANVCGVDGINWMLEKTKDLPIDVFFTVSSCVPATNFDESAYTIDSIQIKDIFDTNNDRILGLAEVMNYPGVINREPEVLKKIEYAKEYGGVIDGHAPMVRGDDLRKYISAGIMSCHESSSIEEAREKIDIARELNQKFYIMMREGTAAKNLETLAPLMNDSRYVDNVMFATDDKHPEEILSNGHIDNSIKKSIKLGIKPEIVYTVASYNASKYFKLNDRGVISKGYKANLVILNDINDCNIEVVIKDGKMLESLIINNWSNNIVDSNLDKKVRNSINMEEVDNTFFEVVGLKKVIELVPGEIITKDGGSTASINVDNDIVKVCVIESHKGTMHKGICYLKGMGLKEGAIGTTVAHDSHYMIIAGTNDSDMALCANTIKEMQGGKTVVKNGKIIEKLALPIANLMTDEEPISVIKRLNNLKNSVHVNEGIDPFMNLSFVSLAVIGNIRLLPGGVFDVNKWQFIK